LPDEGRVELAKYSGGHETVVDEETAIRVARYRKANRLRLEFLEELVDGLFKLSFRLVLCQRARLWLGNASLDKALDDVVSVGEEFRFPGLWSVD
jgi:hypothetical protein